VRAGAHQLGAIVLLDGGRPVAPTADGVLALAAVAALTAAALGDAVGARPRATSALLDELRRAPIEAETLVARAKRLGADLASGAVALRAHADPEHARRAATVVEELARGSLVARRGSDIDALIQAELALALVDARAVTAHEAATGAWHLLIRTAVADPAALRRLRDTSIGPARAHDADHGTELLATFRTYLTHGGNMNAAATAIPSHRHTVAYRLERLKALTGLDPALPDDRERLGLGIKAQAVLDAMDRTAA